jgi:uncharacterized membrane protein YfcA
MTTVEWALTTAVLLAAGVVKGVIGFGLPAVAIPPLSLFLGPLEAVVTISFSVLLTNLINVRLDISEWRLIKNIRPYILTGILTVPFGVLFLQVGNPEVVRFLIGLVVYGYLALQRHVPTMKDLSPAARSGVGAGMGVMAGFLGGMASLPGPVSIVYLSMFQFSKDAFVFLMNVFNSVSSIGLVSTMTIRGIYTQPAILRALAALIPIFLGFWLGIWLRSHLSQELFYRLVKGGLFGIATLLILRGIWKLLL